MDAVALVLSVPEAAQILGVSVRHLARIIAAGSLPSIKIGRRRVIRRDQLVAWLDGLDSRDSRAKKCTQATAL